MGKPQYKQIEKMLHTMKDELIRGIDDDIKEGKEDSKSDIGDLYDVASSERDRELSLLLGERGRSKLQEIEDALNRIREGTYGICEECEEQIVPGRLKVMPFTRVCVNCKSKEEREKGVIPIYEGERRYRKFSISEVKEEEE